jgi:hypothetical protein
MRKHGFDALIVAYVIPVPERPKLTCNKILITEVW